MLSAHYDIEELCFGTKWRPAIISKFHFASRHLASAALAVRGLQTANTI